MFPPITEICMSVFLLRLALNPKDPFTVFASAVSHLHNPFTHNIYINQSCAHNVVKQLCHIHVHVHVHG